MNINKKEILKSIGRIILTLVIILTIFNAIGFALILGYEMIAFIIAPILFIFLLIITYKLGAFINKSFGNNSSILRILLFLLLIALFIISIGGLLFLHIYLSVVYGGLRV